MSATPLKSQAGDPLENLGGNTTEFINKLFPSEASLSGLEPFIQQLRQRIHRIDDDILTSVRLQSTTGTKAKHDVQEAQRVIQELFHQVLEIRRKADQSESIVNEICRDIRKLDHAKQHLTHTISALSNLSQLITSMDKLQDMVESRNYRDAAGLLAAVTQYMVQFESYTQIPKIAELKGRFQTIKAALKLLVADDFKFLGAVDQTPTEESLGILRQACKVVEAMDVQVREEIIGSLCQREVVSFTNIFSAEQGESSRLEKADRRFAWIRKQIFSRQEVWKAFPEHWYVPHSLAAALCKMSRAHIAAMLDAQAGNLDVGALLKALNDSIEFERELTEKFGGPSAALAQAADASALEVEEELQLTDERNPAAAEVKRRYERQKIEAYREQLLKGTEAANRPSFRGIISTVFEPHLSVYVTLVESELLKRVDQLVAEEDWAQGLANDTYGEVLKSANEIFAEIKKNLKRSATLTRGEALASLHKAFSNVLQSYAARLYNKIPRPPPTPQGTAPRAVLGTHEWNVKMTDADFVAVCMIVNTSNYCKQLAQDLAQTVQKLLEGVSVTLDASAELDDFSSTAAQGISSLVLALETQLEPGLLSMTRKDWTSIEVVGDQSDYVTVVNQVLTHGATTGGRKLGENDCRFFLDKLVDSFLPRYQEAVFRCRRLSEAAVQQLLLDAHAIKSLLLELPTLAGRSAYSSHAKMVNRGLAKVEGFLKVVLCVTEATLDTFLAVMPGAGPGDFHRVVEAKNISKQEKQALLEEFQRRFGSAPLPTVAPSQAGQRMQQTMARLGNLGALGMDSLAPTNLNLKMDGLLGLGGMGRDLTDGTKKFTAGVSMGLKKLVDM